MRNLFWEYEEEENNELYYDDEELSFSSVPIEDWNLCENCSNYLNGKCLLDMHEVDPDEPCTYNLKKEKEDNE